MTVTVYRSTDAGAPTLSGLQGSLANVLKGCLVTGYGALPSSGWTAPFTATNITAFQQPATANRRFLVVDETTTTNNMVVFTGYESMTSATSGVNPFPTLAWPSITLPRSNGGNSDGSSRPWVLIATDKMFYLWTCQVVANAWTFAMGFGDFVSYLAEDSYNTILMGPDTGGGNAGLGIIQASANSTVTPGHYVCRNYTQTGGSLRVAKTSDWSKIGVPLVGTAGLPFPNPTDGRVYVAPFYITEVVGSSVGILRGVLPGIYAPCFNAVTTLNDGDKLDNIANMPNKVLEAKYLNYQNTNIGMILLETSNTW